MSDIMLHGVLNMPLPDDPVKIDIVTWCQFIDRAREASRRIKDLEAQLAELEVQLKTEERISRLLGSCNDIEMLIKLAEELNRRKEPTDD